MNIFVSSLSFRAKKEDLAELFTLMAKLLLPGLSSTEKPVDQKDMASLKCQMSKKAMQLFQHLTVQNIWDVQSTLP